jgi:predicted anti-sigma-YlaC factor YlaD
MLTCRELTEVVTAYLERRMGLWDRLQVMLHLGMCRHCRAYLRQIRQTVRALSGLPDEPIAAAVQADLLRRFRAR